MRRCDDAGRCEVLLSRRPDSSLNHRLGFFALVHAPGYRERRFSLPNVLEPGRDHSIAIRLDYEQSLFLRVVDARDRPVWRAALRTKLDGEELVLRSDLDGMVYFPARAVSRRVSRFQGRVEAEGFLPSRLDVLEENGYASFMSSLRNELHGAVVMDRPAVVSGVVRGLDESPTREARITVSLHPWEAPGDCGIGGRYDRTWRAESDELGRYRIEDVPADRPLWWALVDPVGGALHVEGVELEPGPNERDWRLGNAPRLTGVVRDAHGAALPGFALELRFFGQPRAAVVTDRSGRFAIDWIVTETEVEELPDGASGLILERRKLEWSTYQLCRAGQRYRDRPPIRLILAPGMDGLDVELSYDGVTLSLDSSR